MMAAGYLSRYINGPLPYVRLHITVNKKCVECVKGRGSELISENIGSNLYYPVQQKKIMLIFTVTMNY